MSDLSEIKSMVEEQHRLIEAAHKKTSDRIKSLDADLTKLSQDVAGQMLKLNRPAMGGSDTAGFSSADHEYKQAFTTWMRTGREGDLQTKSMSAGSDPDGGYAIPRQLDTLLTKALREMSPMRQLARVVQVDSGDFSMIHSVGGTGSNWLGETEDPGDTTTPRFMVVKPEIGLLSAQPAVTSTMLEDASFDLESWLLEELSETFAASEGAAFISGDGVGKPMGILSYGVTNEADGVRADNKLQYVASGGAGAFAASNPADKLIKLVHSLKPRYRSGAAWLMNTNTIEQVRAMKTASSGDYLWKESSGAAQIGATGTLLGYPIFEDENMPDIAANSLSIAFGNFGLGYTIVDRLTRMVRDPYSKKPYVRFYTAKRVGATVRDFRAIKLMKFAAS